MRHALALLALLAAGPAAAAEDPAAPPRWTVGAGVGLASGELLLPGAPAPVRAPTAWLSAERALGDWLAVELGGGGLYADSATGAQGSSQTSVGLFAGARLYPLGRAAALRPSLLLAGRLDRYNLDVATPGSSTAAWIGGLRLAGALEREVAPGVALRAGAGLLDLSWVRATTLAVTATTRRAVFALDPFLELRLAL